MNKICELENKYIEVLLKKGIDSKHKRPLFISYTQESVDFVSKIVDYAQSIGITDIYLHDEDPYKMHDLLKTISKEEIKTHPFFDQSIWDEYTKKEANFLVLRTQIPSLMSDIDGEKLAQAGYIDKITRSLFRKRQLSFSIPWCYAVVPNQMWADQLFPACEDSYERLFEAICKCCMIDREDPIKEWDNYLEKAAILLKKLNDLEIKSLHYKNKLGTDLKVELSENAFFTNISKLGEHSIPNIPSYENFTSPNMWKTEGILYNAKPLAFNGQIIDDFFLEFKDGRIINFDAKIGKDLLNEILKAEKYSAYLGEASIVEKDSPVALTNLTYYQTTLDENSGTHIAIGTGMSECVLNGEGMSEEELLAAGINPSKNHIDIVIGTDDLDIYAKTKNGKIKIMENGKYTI